MAKKGVFTDELGDIDDLLPASIANPIATPDAGDHGAWGAAAGAPGGGATDTTSDVKSGAADGGTTDTTSDVKVDESVGRNTGTKSTASVPSAQVDPALHDRLVKLTAKERARNTTTARTFAQVVLDAVEHHQAELEKFWVARTESKASGLFRRQKVETSPKRRRKHEKPPARIPLGGIDPMDLAKLDQLALNWNAGSRSALVEQALRFEFKMPATP